MSLKHPLAISNRDQTLTIQLLLDTLDLQDHDTPSAKDHSKQPEQTAPLGGGRPAPHQEQSIRQANQDSKAEMLGVAGTETGHDYRDGLGMYDEAEEIGEELGHNGHYDHEDGDLADGESDDMLDDDLMDKISSSPSIDDGACYRQQFQLHIGTNVP